MGVFISSVNEYVHLNQFLRGTSDCDIQDIKSDILYQSVTDSLANNRRTRKWSFPEPLVLEFLDGSGKLSNLCLWRYLVDIQIQRRIQSQWLRDNENHDLSLGQRECFVKYLIVVTISDWSLLDNKNTSCCGWRMLNSE